MPRTVFNAFWEQLSRLADSQSVRLGHQETDHLGIECRAETGKTGCLLKVFQVLTSNTLFFLVSLAWKAATAVKTIIYTDILVISVNNDELYLHVWNIWECWLSITDLCVKVVKKLCRHFQSFSVSPCFLYPPSKYSFLKLSETWVLIILVILPRNKSKSLFDITVIQTYGVIIPVY